jgi:hypothetical protein
MKTMKTPNAVLAITIALSMTACPKANEAKEPTSNPQAAALAGVWESPCFNKATTRIEYDANLNLKGSYKTFSDENCKDNDSVKHWVGRSEITGAASVPGAWNINVSFQSFNSTALNEGTAQWMNSQKYCGITDWKANTTREVYGEECFGFSIPKSGKSYDIFAVEGDSLRFGVDSKISANPQESERPKAFQPWAFTRVK